MKDRNPTDLAAQQQFANDQQNAAAAERQQELDDVKAMMADPVGRRFLWRLLDKAGVFRTSFTGNSTTFFNEGQRNIGLMYLDLINQASPEKYHVMVSEAAEARKATSDE